MKSYYSSLIRQKASVSKLVRVGLSVVLSASMVFSGVPTSAIYAYADEQLDNSTTEDLMSEDVPSSAPADDEGGEDPQGSDPAVEPTEPAPGETPTDETPADDEPADGQTPSDEKDLDAEEPSDPTAQEASEEEEEEDVSDEGDSPEGVSLAPMAMLGGPLRAAGDSNIVYQGINNPTNTTVDLFDYWITSQNADDRNGRAAGFTNVNGTRTWVNEGINQNHALIFHGGAGGAHPGDCAADIFTEQIGAYGTPSQVWGPVAQGLVTSTLGEDGYPHLNGQYTYTSSNPFDTIGHADSGNGTVVHNTFNRFNVRSNCDPNESLAYLFDPEMSASGKQAYPDVNGLFSVDGEGFYVYNSGNQTANYNPTTNRFDLGSQPSGKNGFWPLDDEGSGATSNNPDGHNDYSGMHMQMSFSMPANGEVLNPQGEYVPMTFTFAGDDDVWVYVDGVLVGDVGGIHQPSSLQINFKTGVVNVNRNFGDAVYQVQNERGAGWPEYVATTNLLERYTTAGRADSTQWNGNTFADGSYHTIDFYYLERGNNESNLVIRFNMVNTGDFTAHKALIANPDENLGHDRFQFELVGLDGRYRRNPDTNEVTVVSATEKALKPKGAENYTDSSAEASPGDVSRYYHEENGNWVYRVGAAADGNVNFGNADFGHVGDGVELGDIFRYVIREVSTPGSAYEADSRVYYMEASIAQDDESGEYYLSKRYYTDDTFTTRATDINFASFVNLKGDVPKATPTLTVNKDLKQDGSLINFASGLFAFEAVDPHGSVVATNAASNTSTHVAQATLTLPTLTAVDFNGVVNTSKTYTYTIREVIPDDATDNGDGTFTVADGTKYKYDTSTYTATFTATYTGTAVNLGDITYTKTGGSTVTTPEFHNEVVPAKLTVVKEWKNAAGTAADELSHDNDSVWVQLYKQTRASATDDWSDDTAVGEPVELKSSNEWTNTFDLAADDTGENVRYVIKEGTKSGDAFTPLADDGYIMAAKTATDTAGRPYILNSVTWSGDDAQVSDGYASVPISGTATETIANKPAVTKVTVVKEWTDATTQTTHPDVWVQLYKSSSTGGDPVAVGDPVKITDETNLTYVFNNLVPTGVYTAAEGTYDGTTFTAKNTFPLPTDNPTKYYTQDSVTYYDKDGEECDDPQIDGTVFPDAGRIVFSNKPFQADISLLKVDADSTGGNAPIAGVAFNLLKDAGTAETYEPTTDTTSVGTVTTTTDGTVSLPKLDPGVYWLLETDVPDSYLLRDANHPVGIKVVISGDTLTVSLLSDSYDTDKTRPTLSGPDSNGAYALTVPNVRTYSLPSAGGPGVYPFLLIGAFVATLSASEASDRKHRMNPRSQGRHGRLGGL